MAKIKVAFSAFDGMSCFQIALKELGIIPEKYYASEVDKYAIGQTMLNFPKTIQLGDIRDVDVSQLDYIDFLAGGSPCQSFSFAGKRKGMATKCEIEITRLDQYLELKSEGFEFEGQSYLFWEYMRILTDIRKYNPNVLFLLENVEMGKKWERVLSEAIGLYGVHINSALVSAQNRKRIYWTNIRTRMEGLFGEIYSDIPQPKDEGILLKDILESEVDEKYYLSDSAINRAIRKEYSQPQINPDKTGTLTTKNNSGQCSFDSGTTLIPVLNNYGSFVPCHQSNYYKGMDNHAQRTMVCVAMRGRNPDNPSDRTTGSPTEQRLEPAPHGKTNCLTTVQKDNLVMCLTPKRTEYGKQIRKQYEVGEVAAMRKEVSQLEPRNDGKTNTITTVQKDNLLYEYIPCDKYGNEGLRLKNDGKTGTLLARERNDESCGQLVCIQQRGHGFNKGNLFEEKSPSVTSNSWEQNNHVVQLNERQLKNFKEINEKADTFLSTSYKGSQANGMTLIGESRIRRLTPTECARLQTVPDWYKWDCSDTQQYKMLGNGWTIEVIKHILSFL